MHTQFWCLCLSQLYSHVCRRGRVHYSHHSVASAPHYVLTQVFNLRRFESEETDLSTIGPSLDVLLTYIDVKVFKFVCEPLCNLAGSAATKLLVRIAQPLSKQNMTAIRLSRRHFRYAQRLHHWRGGRIASSHCQSLAAMLDRAEAVVESAAL